MCAWYKVLHRYGFTQGFQVTGHVGTGMVPNLGTHVKTIPLTMVTWLLRVLQLIIGQSHACACAKVRQR